MPLKDASQPLYAHDNSAKFCAHSINNFADDTTVVGQIVSNGEMGVQEGNGVLGNIVTRQQPLSKCQQNEVTGHLLQEAGCLDGNG